MNSLSGAEIAVIAGAVGYIFLYFNKNRISGKIQLIASLMAIALIGVGAALMHRVHVIGLCVLLLGAVAFQALQFRREKIKDNRYIALTLGCVGIVALGVILALFLEV